MQRLFSLAWGYRCLSFHWCCCYL